jgi:hypothetical protein
VKRLVLLLAVAVVGALSACPFAAAAETEWHSEQPVAAGIDVPVPLGEIGGMAFWGPNKGVLITAGNGGMPAGIYAFDGSSWYLYSTVCGGHEGSIVISGPDEFWTISDYAESQEGTGRPSGPGEWARTLCHFANGEVVASYAEPLASGGYEPLRAAACSGPAECWFAGNPLPETGPNPDAFHLHWDGTSLTMVPSTKVREPEINSFQGAAIGLAFVEGRLFESDNVAPYLREVVPGDPRRFLPIEPLTSPGPFIFSTEPLEQRLWAGNEETGTLLHFEAGSFEQLPTPVTFENGRLAAIGAEPGTESAWLAGGGVANSQPAEVRQVSSTGEFGPIVQLPRPGEGLNPKGGASRIFCAATEQCWLATIDGWLFHLGGPPPEGVNTDPLMHRLITTRPKDASSRSFVAAGLPPDDSGEVEAGPAEPILHEQFPHPRKRPPLVVKVKQSVIDKTILQLAFTLRGKAHVQLVAKHHKSVVAKTARLTLGKGRHRLRLHLDPKRWPTHLDFRVHAIGKPKAK